MKLLSLDAVDDHICVYCRSKFNGLNNYIDHLKNCEPLDSCDKRSLPRLPLLKTPSIESLLLENDSDSLVESRCSSPGSYMQRIYDDMYRYEKEVLGNDSVPDLRYKIESKKECISKGSKDECFISFNFPVKSSQTPVFAEEPSVGKNAQEASDEKLKVKESIMGFNSNISRFNIPSRVNCVSEKSDHNMLSDSEVISSSDFPKEIASVPENSIINRGDKIVSKESGLSLSSLCVRNLYQNRENLSDNICGSAQNLLRSDCPDQLLESHDSNLSRMRQTVNEYTPTVAETSPKKNVVPSMELNTNTINHVPEPAKNIPLSSMHDEADQKDCTTGFTKKCDAEVAIYEVWGKSPESTFKSLKDCMYAIFPQFSPTDKDNIIESVGKLCHSHIRAGKKLLIKLTKTNDRFDLSIKDVVGEVDENLESGNKEAALRDPTKEEDSSKASLNTVNHSENLPNIIGNKNYIPKEKDGGRINDSELIAPNDLVKESKYSSNNKESFTLKAATDLAVNKVKSTSGNVFDVINDNSCIYKSNVIADYIKNEPMEAEAVLESTTVTEETRTSYSEVLPVDCKTQRFYEKRSLEPNVSSPGEIGKQLKLPVATRPCKEYANTSVHYPMKDREVEVGQSYFLSDDLETKGLDSLPPILKDSEEESSKRTSCDPDIGVTKNIESMRIEESSNEQLLQGKNLMTARSNRIRRGGYRRRINSRKTPHEKVAETETSQHPIQIGLDADRVQRYHLRTRQSESCSTIGSSQVNGNTFDASTLELNLDGGADLFKSKLQNDVVGITKYREGYKERRRKPRILRSATVHRQKQAMHMHAKITSLDSNEENINQDSISDAAAHRKEEKNYLETRNDDLVRNESGYCMKNTCLPDVVLQSITANSCNPESSMENVDFALKRLNASCTALQVSKDQDKMLCDKPLHNSCDKNSVQLTQLTKNSPNNSFEGNETKSSIITESALYVQDKDGHECRSKNALSNCIITSATSEITDTCIKPGSLQPASVNCPSKHNVKVEMESDWEAESFDFSSPSNSMHENVGQKEPISRSVKLENNPENLQFMKSLKPLTINLGFRCDSDEFLSHLRKEINAAKSVSLRKRRRRKTSFRQNDHGDESMKRKMEFQSTDDHERKRRLNNLEKFESISPTFRDIPELKPEFSLNVEENYLEKFNSDIVEEFQDPPALELAVESDKRSLVQTSSTVQIVHEVREPIKEINLKQTLTYNNKIKGGIQSEPTKDKGSFSPSPLASYKTLSIGQPYQLVESKQVKNYPIYAANKLFAAHSIMCNGMATLFLSKNIDLGSVNTCGVQDHKFVTRNMNVNKSEDITGLSKVKVTNVRSREELTEEERDIPIVVTNVRSSEELTEEERDIPIVVTNVRSREELTEEERDIPIVVTNVRSREELTEEERRILWKQI